MWFEAITAENRTEEREQAMAERATLPIRVAEGTPLVLVLTDQPALVLQGALELEQKMAQAEEKLAQVMLSHPLIGRLLRYLVMPKIEEAERFIKKREHPYEN